jgi:hypothetical protein
VDDLSYDEMQYEEAPSVAGPVLTGLVVLLIVVLGAPQVWDVVRSGSFGPAVLYYPVLAVALGYLAARGRRS